MWKDVPLLFFPYKQEEKCGTQATQAWKSTPPPTEVPPNGVKRNLAVLLSSTWCSYVQIQHSFRREEQWGGGGGGWGGGWGLRERTSACVSSLFSLLVGKNNTGTSFHITQVGLRSLGGFWHTWKFDTKCRLLQYAIVAWSHSIFCLVSKYIAMTKKVWLK